MTEKACSRCGVVSTNFRPDTTGFLGLRSVCRPCDRARDAAYKKTNRHQTRLHRQCWRAGHRARLAGTGGYINAHDWAAICDYFGHRCAYCGCQPETLTLDHLHPLSEGGRNEAANIVPACGECNSRKGALSLLDFTLAWTVPFLGGVIMKEEFSLYVRFTALVASWMVRAAEALARHGARVAKIEADKIKDINLTFASREDLKAIASRRASLQMKEMIAAIGADFNPLVDPTPGCSCPNCRRKQAMKAAKPVNDTKTN